MQTVCFPFKGPTPLWLAAGLANGTKLPSGRSNLRLPAARESKSRRYLDTSDASLAPPPRRAGEISLLWRANSPHLLLTSQPPHLCRQIGANTRGTFRCRPGAHGGSTGTGYGVRPQQSECSLSLFAIRHLQLRSLCPYFLVPTKACALCGRGGVL